MLGLVVHQSVYGFDVMAVTLALGSALVLAVALHLAQVWGAVVVLGTADCLLIYVLLRPQSGVLLATVLVALLVSTSLQIGYQWEKAVLLRFGTFRALKPSGVFLVVPIIDKVAQFVDQRIRVSDFCAETTLTADTVPVSVDAIAFWMVWDAQKAVLEVEAFMHAVVLSAQTRGMTATTRWTHGPAPTFAAAARVLLPPSRLQSGRVTRHPNRGAQGPLAPRPPVTLLRSPSGLPPHRTRPMLRQRSRSAIDTPGPSPLLKEKLRKTGCRLSA